jgi:hypothetical protein
VNEAGPGYVDGIRLRREPSRYQNQRRSMNLRRRARRSSLRIIRRSARRDQKTMP